MTSKITSELINFIISEYGYGKLLYFIDKPIELYELDHNGNITFEYSKATFGSMMKMYNISVRKIADFVDNEDKPILIVRRNRKPLIILYRFKEDYLWQIGTK